MKKLPFTKRDWNKAKRYANRMCEIRQEVIDSAQRWAEVAWESASSDEAFTATGELQLAVENLIKFEGKK